MMREIDRALIESPAWACVGAVLLGFAVAAIPSAFAQTPPRDFAAGIVDCHDGDTCKLTITEPNLSVFAPIDLTHREDARLCDVNAPELKGETLATAKFARDRLLEWARAAKVLRFRPALDKSGRAKREKYGRLLGWIIADGVVLNDRLVAEGLAARYIECAP